MASIISHFDYSSEKVEAPRMDTDESTVSLVHASLLRGFFCPFATTTLVPTMTMGPWTRLVAVYPP